MEFCSKYIKMIAKIVFNLLQIVKFILQLIVYLLE